MLQILWSGHQLHLKPSALRSSSIWSSSLIIGAQIGDAPPRINVTAIECTKFESFGETFTLGSQNRPMSFVRIPFDRDRFNLLQPHEKAIDFINFLNGYCSSGPGWEEINIRHDSRSRENRHYLDIHVLSDKHFHSKCKLSLQFWF